MHSLRVAGAQINPTVGDLEGNVTRVIRAIEEADAEGCDLVCFPEMVLTGYPPEYLLLKDGFIADATHALETVAKATGDCVAIVGTVLFADELDVAAPSDARLSPHRPTGRRPLANVGAVLAKGRVIGLVVKRLLPNYAVFDEQRWFVSGTGPHPIFRVGGSLVGVAVCEDLWSAHGPAVELANAGADLIVSLNASPFSIRQQEERRSVLSARVAETGCPVLYVNMVGGQDELVFDGDTQLVAGNGDLLARAGTFVEDLMIVDLPVRDVAAADGVIVVSETSRATGPSRSGVIIEPATSEHEVYQALVTGTRDYLAKNGFAKAVIGLSGGIDSTIVATIAVDALGSENVRGISMPSRYSSLHSRSDAEDLAERLGIELDTIEIEPAHTAFGSMLAGPIGGVPVGLTDENLQSRLRGVLLMAISNETGAIVLTTGNKSEMATGYSTLYGDSAGGFAVIKDVPKTLVYELCRFRNQVATAAGEVAPIPVAVIDKPPSAELRPDQFDEDSLPPYELLDPILAAYVESDCTAPELVAMGHDPALVDRVVRLVDLSEYKRRQMPPGVRITTKAFGKDRRMPITNGYRRRPSTEPSIEAGS